MLLRDADMVLFVCVAFPKDFPHEAHPRQGVPPEPVSSVGGYRAGRGELKGYVDSPIPQWFRLKTDTKIQVRLTDIRSGELD